VNVTRRTFLSGSALCCLFGSGLFPGVTRAATSVPWRNWSGGVVAHPKDRFSPQSEAQLIEFLVSADGPVRPVGSGHSFTPLVPTDGYIVVLDKLTGLIDHDAGTLQATFAAGTRLGDMGSVLESIGQGMFNLGSAFFVFKFIHASKCRKATTFWAHLPKKCTKNLAYSLLKSKGRK